MSVLPEKFQNFRNLGGGGGGGCRPPARVPMLNGKKSLQQLPSCVIATRDSQFCKMFSPLFCLKGVEKLYTSKIKKQKKKQRRQVTFGT